MEFEGGVEFRDIARGSEVNDFDSPVFNLGVDWSATELTKISLDVFQNGYSTVDGDGVRRTGIRGEIRKRFAKRFAYTLGGGVEHVRFDSFRGSAADREEDYFFVRNALEWRWKWGTIGCFHEFRRNDSTTGSDFRRNQAGIGVRFEF